MTRCHGVLVSSAPCITNPTAFDNRVVLICGFGGKAGIQGVLTHQYKYGTYYSGKVPPGQPAELFFDVIADPWEMTNLATSSDPTIQAIKAQMKALGASMRVCAGPTCQITRSSPTM